LSLNYEVSSGVPSTLQDYKSVFVLLGSLFSYHILSQDEGTILSEYLENNGNLYMEGRSTWMQQQTPVHTMFDVEPVSDGSYFPVDTIYTIQKDSINQKSLIFTNEQPYSNHYFLSKEGALPFLNFKKMDSACVVTNKTDTYHTIASILEYGSLAEIDTSFTKVDYLNQIADFFELYQTTTGINEHSVIEGDYSTIKVYPNPFRDYVNIQINQSEFIKVKIFNSSGDLIYMEHLNTKASKTNVREVIWDGRDLNKRDVASGIYFIRIQTNNSYTSAKIIKW
jgi:hypothetical protein